MATLEERFWAKVDRKGPDECWKWWGSTTGFRYGQINVGNGVRVLAHRLSWEWAKGPIPEGKYLDHICRCRSCVNPAHLRLATRAENMHNTGKNSRNTSGFKGVSRNRKRWAAGIVSEGVYRYLGTFDTPEEAHAAYCVAAKQLHGEFANTGEVE